MASESCSTTSSIRAAHTTTYDLAVAHLDGERLDVLGRRQRQHGAGAEVESGAVARADDLEPLALALAQRAVVVAAPVLERVHLPVDPVDAEEQRPRLDDLHPALGDVVERPYADFHSMSRSSESSPRATREHVDRKQGALEPDGRERDAELLEHVLAAERAHLGDRLALDDVRDHRRGGLADRAAAAVEANVAHDAAVDVELDRELVAAERVHALGGDRRVVEMPAVARVLVVIEDVLAVEVVHSGGILPVFRREPGAARPTRTP